MVYATGDTHGNFRRLTRKFFPELEKMTREDCIIVCGDFGGVWDDSPSERYWLDWLAEKPFTPLFVDGNHENFDRLYALPEQEWHGGKVHKVRENVLHLMRGQLYEIEGHTFFTMGGASSHDIWDGILDPDAPDFRDQYKYKVRTNQAFRILGWSWWPQELPSDEEYLTALAALEKAKWKVDYVITHCAPSGVQQVINRSEERRVGKECRSRWSPYH